MTNISRRVLTAFTSMVMLFVAGCASTEPPRFYTLSPVKSEEPVSSGNIAGKSSLLFVGPLFIPDYLDRPQIVSRTGNNEILIAEFDRWAGSLKADITRVLVEDLSFLLSSEPVTVLPWRAVTTAAPASATRCRVVIEMTRFEGTLGDGVRLDATWGLVDSEWQDLMSRRTSQYREPVSGKDYSALVDAMSRALASLSRDIAGAVKPHLTAPQK